jgi:hypothetical protein
MDNLVSFIAMATTKCQRGDRLRNLYARLGVDSTKIIAKPFDCDIPDFTTTSYVSDQNIARYPELFFSDNQHIDNYVRKFGIIQMSKLFNAYGFNFEDFAIKITIGKIFDCGFDSDRTVADEDLKYFMENYHTELNFQEILDNIFIKEFIHCRPLYVTSADLCVENGACIHLAYDTLCEYIESCAKTWGPQGQFPRLKYSCLDFSVFDVNRILKILTSRSDSIHHFRDHDLTDWIIALDDKFDYTNTLIIKFLLYASSVNIDSFHTVMSKLVVMNYFDRQHWPFFVKSVNQLAKITQMSHEDFFANFVPYGIDFVTIFDNYIDCVTGDDFVDIIIILEADGLEILRKLAINRGLISD